MSQNCIVVGAGPGIGTAVARRFAAAGYAVGAIARSAKTVAAAAAACKEYGVTTVTATANAADEHALGNAIDHVVGMLGLPAVLVYNAYAVTPGNALSLKAEGLIADLRANVAGALVAAQHVALAMIGAGGGTILFTGGGAALSGSTTWPSLGIGKAGLRHLTWDLAESLEPSGVHVATVTICGAVKPDTHFSPERIAEEYWRLHAQSRPDWQREIMYQ